MLTCDYGFEVELRGTNIVKGFCSITYMTSKSTLLYEKCYDLKTTMVLFDKSLITYKIFAFGMHYHGKQK